MIESLVTGFGLVLHPYVLLALFGGTIVGYIIGAMPGLGPSLGVALLVPFTYGVDPVVAMVGLVGLYMAAEYAGAVTAVILNTPGTAAAVATAWDGYPMAKKGEAGWALHVSIISSGIGALLSAILLIGTAIPLSEFALRFGPPEYFALALFGLSLVTSLGGSSVLRGLLSLFLGVAIAVIGMDPVTGIPRFAITSEFFEGIPLVPMLLGLYAVSEALYMLEGSTAKTLKVTIGNVLSLHLSRYRPLMGTILRSSGIGYFIGVIPGAGASIASLIAYSHAKRRNGNNEPAFGEGNPAGVAASEAANNAAVSGALAPLLALGVPGSATAAVLIGALMIQGIQPGPMLFVNNPEIPYSVFASILIGTPLMVIVGLLGARLWVKVTAVPQSLLAALVIGISIVGAFASTNSMFPVYVTLVFGIIGYVLRKVDIPTAPIVLALVLVPMAEANYRRALVVADGSHTIFFLSPISLVLLLAAASSFLVPLIKRYRQSRKN
ncbi:tripartite tricarboxylate transporter permease [Advenella sp. FME57]|uniref:tripartite tricarboxylate transporter permease n=1 Tax=Advenella sp. FME57 TaxID=2742604 RepID=UPI00186642EA|nr:tripartite tricarboxylate transporter permease [Advenella sp. FME57]